MATITDSRTLAGYGYMRKREERELPAAAIRGGYVNRHSFEDPVEVAGYVVSSGELKEFVEEHGQLPELITVEDPSGSCTYAKTVEWSPREKDLWEGSRENFFEEDGKLFLSERFLWATVQGVVPAASEYTVRWVPAGNSPNPEENSSGAWLISAVADANKNGVAMEWIWWQVGWKDDGFRRWCRENGRPANTRQPHLGRDARLEDVAVMAANILSRTFGRNAALIRVESAKLAGAFLTVRVP